MVHTVNDGSGAPKYGTVLDFSNISGGKTNLIGKEFQVTCSVNCSQTFTFKFTDATTSTATTASGSGSGPNLNVEIGINDPNLHSGADIVNEIMTQAKSQSGTMGTSTITGDAKIGHANGMSADGSKLILYSTNTYTPNRIPQYSAGMGLVKTLGLDKADGILHIQAGSQPWQDIKINLTTVNSSTLGVNGLLVDSFENAGKSMDSLDNAIATVSERRSYFGAMHNRLEAAKKVDDNASENTQAAESRLRDTDMAKEIMENSKQNILEQAIQSMMAQANQSTQGVLALLS